MYSFYRFHFKTLGEQRAAQRGWADAGRGLPVLEESEAYRKGYFDRVDYDDIREERGPVDLED